MKILVDKLPKTNYYCKFRCDKDEYDICKLTESPCYDIKNCPNLEEIDNIINALKKNPISNIDMTYITRIVMLSEAEIKNLLITTVIDEKHNDMCLVNRLENAAYNIYSEQLMRLFDYVTN